jgi:hypothetical protein
MKNDEKFSIRDNPSFRSFGETPTKAALRVLGTVALGDCARR